MALPPATHSSGCCQGFEAQLPPPKAVQPRQPRRWDQAPLLQCFIDLLPGVKVGLSTHRTQHPSPPLPDSPAAPLNAGLRFPTIICAALMASHLITETHALSCSYLDTNPMPQLMLFSLPWFSTVMLFGPHCRRSLTQPHRVRSHHDHYRATCRTQDCAQTAPVRPLPSCSESSPVGVTLLRGAQQLPSATRPPARTSPSPRARSQQQNRREEPGHKQVLLQHETER